MFNLISCETWREFEEYALAPRGSEQKAKQNSLSKNGNDSNNNKNELPNKEGDIDSKKWSLMAWNSNGLNG